MMDEQIRNMWDVEQLIGRRRQVLSRHGLFRLLEGPGDIEQIKQLIPRLAFFIMSFQDVLRLAFERSVEANLREMSRLHYLEDRGHDLWYLSDLAELGLSLDVSWMYSASHQLTRDVSYGHIAEVLTAVDDRTRLAVTLCLEAVGAEFFGRIIGFLERAGRADGLRYFARRHETIEQNHQIFEEESKHSMMVLSVPAASASAILGAVDRTFARMSTLATDLEAHFASAAVPPLVHQSDSSDVSVE
jgi:hypothetical protein